VLPAYISSRSVEHLVELRMVKAFQARAEHAACRFVTI
jgi:hypothetical protein